MAGVRTLESVRASATTSGSVKGEVMVMPRAAPRGTLSKCITCMATRGKHPPIRMRRLRQTSLHACFHD